MALVGQANVYGINIIVIVLYMGESGDYILAFRKLSYIMVGHYFWAMCLT